MRYQVVKSQVSVIGTIWMPSVTCAMDYTLSGYDLENIRDDAGEITREGVEDWLGCHSGDFAEIIDFRADIADGDSDLVFEWADADSECVYSDCMFPEYDEVAS